MLAFASAWIALASLALAVVMVAYRPAMTDLTVLLVTYVGTPAALSLALMVLWAFRNVAVTTPGVSAQRLQAKVAVVLAVIAAAIVYGLIGMADRISPIEPGVG